MALSGIANKTSTSLRILVQPGLFLRMGVFGLILILYPGKVISQTINGSVYSYYGVGNLIQRASGYNRAMGFTGAGVRDDIFLNTVNPASYNSMRKPFTTCFELGASYESIKHEDEVSSSKTKAGNLTSINILFKPKPKWGVLFGIAPLTTVNYKATSTRLFGSLQPVPVTYEGSGGLNQFYIGTAYELFKNFSVGGNFAYYLGTVKRSENYAAVAGLTDQLYVANRVAALNWGFDLGAQYTINLKEETKIVLGGTWDRGATLTGTQQTSIVNSTLDTLKKTDNFNVNFRMPPNYGAGASLTTGRSVIALDAHYYNWQQAIVNDGQAYRDVWRYSAGYEFRGDLAALTYLSAISLRAGAFVQDYPVVTKNTPFKVWGYTVGLGLPLDNARAWININYAYTQMGTTKSGLVREQSNRLVLDFIIRDVWGYKRKLD